jgi:hypothetical protein
MKNIFLILIILFPVCLFSQVQSIDGKGERQRSFQNHFAFENSIGDTIYSVIQDSFSIHQYFKLLNYGGGTTIGTEAYLLGVEADGDVIEVDGSSIVDTVLGIATKYDLTQIEKNSTTVSDYAALRLYAGSATVVFVSDFTYIFNSISYTTRGGIFRKTTGLTENGSTKIVGVFDWERIHEGFYYPEWFEVGGYDASGIIYTDKNTAQTGIYNEADRIRNISLVAGLGGTIKFEGGKTYTGIDIRASVKANQTWDGNGATLKRADCPQVLLTASASIGANSITVDNVDSLRAGQFIGISDLSATNGGIGFDENTQNGGHLIQSIVGNVVTFSNTLCCAFDIGDRVFINSSFLVNISGDDYQNLNIFNLKIDGNKSKNQYTVDWRLNPNFNLGTGKNLVINNVTFSNIPSENIFASQCNCINLKGNNLNGSLFHISASSVDSNNVSRFINCDLDSVNVAGNALMNHSEAAITWSQNVGKVVIDNCIFRNGQEGVTGGGGSSSIGGMQITNSVFENFDNTEGDLFLFSTSTVDVKKENFLIANNRFENCGDIQFLGKNLKKGFSISKINIINNYFINTRFFFSNVSEVRFENNDVIEKRGFGGFTGFTSPLTGQDAMVQFSRFDRLRIINNRIIADTLYDANIARGLLLYAYDTGKRKDASGVNTEILYGQDVKVLNNTISNFGRCLSVDISHARAWDAVVVGWEFRGNTISMYKDDSYSSIAYGMQVPPNCIASHNTIYSHVDGNGNAYPIWAYGIDDGAATGRENRLPGAIVRYNNVYGKTTRSMAVGSSTGSTSQHNAIVEFNILPKNINDFAQGNSYIQNNHIRSVTLPALTNPTILELSELEQYKTQY